MTRLRQLFRLGWVASIVGLLPAVSGQADSQRFTTQENAFFEIVGPAHRSVSFMNDLSLRVAESAFRLMRRPAHPMPRRVLIQLRDAASVGFDGDYLITLEDRGYVTLTFKWRKDLPLENTVYGVARAFFIQYAYSILGPSYPRRMRAWPVSLLSTLTYLQLRPAQTLTFMEDLRDRPPPRLTGLLEEPLLMIPAAAPDRNGYWLWLVLRREFGISAPDLAGFMRTALQGESIESRLDDMVRIGDDPPPLETWWRNGLVAEAQRNYTLFESMDVSRQWLHALTNFDGLEGVSEEEPPTLPRLWKLRSDAALRAALEARLELIRAGIGRVNPAYFNSAQALGALYETVLESDRKYEFIGALTLFLNDFDDMRRLHEAVAAELDGR